MAMETAQVRKLFISTFNHRFDGNARRELPDLSEEQRFLLALQDLAEQGVTELKENDIVWCLANVQKAHTTRTHKPSRRGDGSLMSQESATRANDVTYNILELFIRYGYLPESQELEE